MIQWWFHCDLLWADFKTFLCHEFRVREWDTTPQIRSTFTSHLSSGVDLPYHEPNQLVYNWIILFKVRYTTYFDPRLYLLTADLRSQGLSFSYGGMIFSWWYIHPATHRIHRHVKFYASTFGSEDGTNMDKRSPIGIPLLTFFFQLPFGRLT